MLLVCCIPAFAIIPSEGEIPADESDGRDLVATGILDTAVWQLLRPLYRRPIDVPAGELPRLFAIFPELGGSTPSDPAELDRFQPWDERSIGLFFSEYPQLQRFRPVLRFNRHPRGLRTGSVGFHLCRFTDDTAASHAVNVAAAPATWLRFQGAADFSTDHARWERRLLTLDPMPAISVDIGNGTFFQDNGLIYGALPAYRPDGDDVRSNWLFGEAATWNGVVVRSALPAEKLSFAPQISCFLHARPTEKIAGGTASFSVNERLSVLIGASRMALSGSMFGTLYGYGSLKLRRGGFTSDLNFAIGEGTTVGVPLLWKTAARHEKRSTELLVIHLPQGYHAPLSGQRRSFINEMEYDDTLRSAVTLARFSSGNTDGGTFDIIPQADIWFEDVYVHHGTLRLNGRVSADRFSGKAIFSQDFGSERISRSVSVVSAQADYRFLPVFSLTAAGRYTFGVQSRQGIHSSLAPSILLFGCSRFEPFLSLSTRDREISSTVIGLSERTTLFERTFTEFIFKKEMIVTSREDPLHVEGRISFVF